VAYRINPASPAPLVALRGGLWVQYQKRDADVTNLEKQEEGGKMVDRKASAGPTNGVKNEWAEGGGGGHGR